MKTESVLSLDELEQLEALCLLHENATTAAERDIADLLVHVSGNVRSYFLRELLWQDIELRQRIGERILSSDYVLPNPQDHQIVEEVIGELQLEIERGESNFAKSIQHVLPLRYQMSEQVGQGGVGEVWRVQDLNAQRPLAIKVLRKKYRRDRQAGIRLEREAIVTGKLQHPGVPPVHDHGYLSDESAFFTMKLVEGKTLSEILIARSNDHSDFQQLIGIFEQVAQTMAYAHSQNVIHRDLKPQNIMVGKFGEVQVMDWGMAKRLDAADAIDSVKTVKPVSLSPLTAQSETITNSIDSSLPERELTRFGDVVGTPAYMAPEQARGEKNLSPATDVFGLGAILFEILTGSKLYEKTSARDIVSKAASADFENALELLEQSQVDPNLIALCKDCLDKNRENRLQDGSRVAERLSDFQIGLQKRLQQNEIEKAAARVKAVESKRRRRVKTSLFTVLALTVLAGFAATGWQWNKTAKALKESDRQRTIADAQSDLAFKTISNVVYDYQEAFEILQQEEFSSMDLADTGRIRKKMLDKLLAGMQQISEQLKEHKDFNRNVMVTHLDLADFYLSMGDEDFKDARDLARAEFQTAAKIGKAFLETTPEHQYGQRLYAQSLEGLARVAFYNENFSEAGMQIDKAIEVEQVAWKKNRESPSIPNDLIRMNYLAGTIQLKNYDLKASAEYFLETVNVYETGKTEFGIEFENEEYFRNSLIPETKTRYQIVTNMPGVRENPASAFEHDTELASRILYDCARWHLHDGELEAGARLLQMVQEIDGLRLAKFYDIACGYAKCMESILDGRKFEELDGAQFESANQYLNKSLAALETARAGNYFKEPMSIGLLGRDTDLDSIRGTKEFETFFDLVRGLNN